MKRLLLTAAVASVLCAPASAQLTITTAVPTVSFSATLSLSASITLGVPSGLTVVQDTRTADSAVIVFTGTPVSSSGAVVVTAARPAHVVVFDRYDADFRARGWTRLKVTTNPGIAKGEYRRGSERVMIESRARDRGAEVRVKTVGGPKLHAKGGKPANAGSNGRSKR